jgi:putative IMPACT (imprinted ancient) family translation regulator
MAEETSEGVYEYVRKFNIEDFLAKNKVNGSIFLTTILQIKHQNESMTIDRKFKITDSLARNMFSRSIMEYSLG